MLFSEEFGAPPFNGRLGRLKGAQRGTSSSGRPVTLAVSFFISCTTHRTYQCHLSWKNLTVETGPTVPIFPGQREYTPGHDIYCSYHSSGIRVVLHVPRSVVATGWRRTPTSTRCKLGTCSGLKIYCRAKRSLRSIQQESRSTYRVFYPPPFVEASTPSGEMCSGIR
jgi:hypothetical protein